VFFIVSIEAAIAACMPQRKVYISYKENNTVGTMGHLPQKRDSSIKNTISGLSAVAPQAT
jgi:hypothetical protein